MSQLAPSGQHFQLSLSVHMGQHILRPSCWAVFLSGYQSSSWLSWLCCTSFWQYLVATCPVVYFLPPPQPPDGPGKLSHLWPFLWGFCSGFVAFPCGCLSNGTFHPPHTKSCTVVLAGQSVATPLATLSPAGMQELALVRADLQSTMHFPLQRFIPNLSFY